MLSSLLNGGMNFASLIVYILSTLAVIFLTLPIHEYAHGLIATKLGDPTPRYQGRLTLNPMAHIDWFGALCMILFGVGWARPVQVNARYFKSPKWGMALTAAAGPIANLIMALIFLFITNGISVLAGFIPAVASYGIYPYYFVFYIAQINVYLAVFNLIPIPPLDGSRLLSALLPYKYYYKLMRYEQYSFIILMAILFVFSRIGFNPISDIADFITGILAGVAALPFSFIG